jgi:hypothetical protein
MIYTTSRQDTDIRVSLTYSMHSRYSTVWALPTSRCQSSKRLSVTQNSQTPNEVVPAGYNSLKTQQSTSILALNLVSVPSSTFASLLQLRAVVVRIVILLGRSNTLGRSHVPFCPNPRCNDRLCDLPPFGERNHRYELLKQFA